MSTNVMIMVLGIIAITSFTRIYMAKHGLVRTRGRNGSGYVKAGPDPDAERMREEIKVLKERIAVLERITTETNSAVALDREIEKLR